MFWSGVKERRRGRAGADANRASGDGWAGWLAGWPRCGSSSSSSSSPVGLVYNSSKSGGKICGGGENGSKIVILCMFLSTVSR